MIADQGQNREVQRLSVCHYLNDNSIVTLTGQSDCNSLATIWSEERGREGGGGKGALEKNRGRRGRKCVCD